MGTSSRFGWQCIGNFSNRRNKSQNQLYNDANVLVHDTMALQVLKSCIDLVPNIDRKTIVKSGWDKRYECSDMDEEHFVKLLCIVTLKDVPEDVNSETDIVKWWNMQKYSQLLHEWHSMFSLVKPPLHANSPLLIVVHVWGLSYLKSFRS